MPTQPPAPDAFHPVGEEDRRDAHDLASTCAEIKQTLIYT
jgi:hypothetical protein